MTDRGLEFIPGGEAFFPRLLTAIASAQEEILIEMYIFETDEIGLQILDALVGAASRGVRVQIIVDALGTPHFTEEVVAQYAKKGVLFKIFRPLRNSWDFRRFFFRRLHRKTIVIDRDQAFVAGLNFSKEYAKSFDRQGKWDAAVVVYGSLAKQVRWHSRQLWKQLHFQWRAFVPSWRRHPKGINSYVVSDSQFGFRSIERTYSAALKRCREEVIIANAYFFPSHRFVRLLEATAKRGVRIRLLLQGSHSDVPLLKLAERSLYKRLITSGIEIYEFKSNPLHAKIAVIDLAWAIVGSSNLDPWSVFSNLEGDIVSMDPRFAYQVRRTLDEILTHHSQRVDVTSISERTFWARIKSSIAYYLFRYAIYLTRAFNR